MSDPSVHLSPRRRSRWALRDSAESLLPARYRHVLLLLGLLVTEAAILMHHVHEQTNFDEGVYLNSLRALEHGWHLGSQVFASQPPGFYILLRGDAFAVGHSLYALRLGFAAVELVGCASAFVIASVVANFRSGLAASLFFATATPLTTIATHVSADGPAISLDLAAVAVLMCGWCRPCRTVGVQLVLSALGGALLAAAAAVKLDAASAVAAAAALALYRRPGRASLAFAVLGAAVVIASLTIAYADVRTQLWHSVVSFHLAARRIHDVERAGGTAGLAANLRHIVSAFHPTSNAMSWLLALGLAGFAIELRRNPRAGGLLLAWPAVACAFLLVQRPLFTEHMVLLGGALAPPAAIGFVRLAELHPSPHRRTVIGIAVTLLLAGATLQLLIRRVNGETARTLAAVHALRTHSRPGEYVVATDVPAAAYLAGRNVPPTLVDTSWVRLLSGSLHPLQITHAIQAFHVTTALAGPRLLDSRPARHELHLLFRRAQEDGDALLFFDRRT